MYAKASIGSGVLHGRKNGVITSQHKAQRKPVADALSRFVTADFLPEMIRTRLIYAGKRTPAQ